MSDQVFVPAFSLPRRRNTDHKIDVVGEAMGETAEPGQQITKEADAIFCGGLFKIGDALCRYRVVVAPRGVAPDSLARVVGRQVDARRRIGQLPLPLVTRSASTRGAAFGFLSGESSKCLGRWKVGLLTKFITTLQRAKFFDQDGR